MKQRDIGHKEQSWKKYLRHMQPVFLIICLVSFSIFSLYANIIRIVFAPKSIDLVEQDIQDIALYFHYYDKEVSRQLLYIHQIIQGYQKGENIFSEYKQELDSVVEYIQENKEYLIQVGFGKYESLFTLIIDTTKHTEEIYELLGQSGPQHFLVVLQNTGEKRPNGGFFGSFVILSIDKGFITNIEIIDSYYPVWLAPNQRVSLPEWSIDLLGTQDVSFIAANKFGFTRSDGANIKKLYDNIFNNPAIVNKKEQVIDPDVYESTAYKNISGVIFLRSDMIRMLIPQFENILYERQFVNASIDLIRGADLPDKKQVYKKELEQYFQANKTQLLQQVVKKIDKVLDYPYINIYIANASSQLQEILEKHNLITGYRPSRIYARDTNMSHNKIDNHVDKNITIYDAYQTPRVRSKQDIVDIQGLEKGSYLMEVTYTLQVPESYIDLVYELEKKYDISIGSREKGIMGIQPVLDYVTGEPTRRETIGQIYFPPNSTIETPTGDYNDHSIHSIPFAQVLKYTMKIQETNNSSRTIRIPFTLY